MNTRIPALSDFWPSYQPSLEDFYPNGLPTTIKLSANRALLPPMIPELHHLIDRIIDGLEAEKQLAAIAKWCMVTIQVVRG